MIREIRSDEDLGTYAAVWSAVRPRDAVGAEFVKDRLRREPERLYLLAEEDGDVVGCGGTTGSSLPGHKWVLVAVVPERRRHGLGTALLERCLEHARALGGEVVLGNVWEDCPEGLAFTAQHRFEEFERGVELVRDLGREEPPRPPEGIEIGELAKDHLSGAYEVWGEGVLETWPSYGVPSVPSFERWLEQVRSQPLVLVALDGGSVVGFAALEERRPGVLDNQLTTVTGTHRRRGIAEALKRMQFAWGVEHGYHQILTSNDEVNVAMRRLNEKLGYRPLPALVALRKPI